MQFKPCLEHVTFRLSVIFVPPVNTNSKCHIFSLPKITSPWTRIISRERLCITDVIKFDQSVQESNHWLIILYQFVWYQDYKIVVLYVLNSNSISTSPSLLSWSEYLVGKEYNIPQASLWVWHLSFAEKNKIKCLICSTTTPKYSTPTLDVKKVNNYY